MKKTKALLKNETLREYIPPTKNMTPSSLLEMLRAHRMVYIKPNVGSYGNGVIRAVWRSGQRYPYRYHAGEEHYKFTDFPSMYASILRRTKHRNYLVQKGIHLLKYRGRRFDLRVMVQQNPHRTWETTGLIGRVAHPRKIVTNYHNGGRLKSVESLLARYIPGKGRKRFIDELSQLGTRVAHQLQSMYPGLRELGLDVALDRELKPWILEVNTAPDPYIFRVLKNKRIFAKVLRYHRALAFRRRIE